MNAQAIDELKNGISDTTKSTKDASKAAGQLRIRIRSLKKAAQANKYRKQLNSIISAHRGKLSRVTTSITDVVKTRNQIENMYGEDDRVSVTSLIDQLEVLKFHMENLLGKR